MSPETIAQLLLKGMELTLAIREDIPKAEREKFWVRHFERMEFIESLWTNFVKQFPQPEK